MAKKSVAQRRAEGEKRLLEIEAGLWGHVKAMELLRQERIRILASLRRLGQPFPGHAARAASVYEAPPPPSLGARAPRASRPPPGAPGGVEKAKAKLAAQGKAFPTKPRRRGAHRG